MLNSQSQKANMTPRFGGTRLISLYFLFIWISFKSWTKIIIFSKVPLSTVAQKANFLNFLLTILRPLAARKPIPSILRIMLENCSFGKTLGLPHFGELSDK